VRRETQAPESSPATLRRAPAILNMDGEPRAKVQGRGCSVPQTPARFVKPGNEPGRNDATDEKRSNRLRVPQRIRERRAPLPVSTEPEGWGRNRVRYCLPRQPLGWSRSRFASARGGSWWGGRTGVRCWVWQGSVRRSMLWGERSPGPLCFDQTPAQQGNIASECFVRREERNARRIHLEKRRRKLQEAVVGAFM
jgi:hypothetical protein